MFIDFFGQLRAARVPVSLKEYLMLMEAMEHGIAAHSIDDFYHLSRATLVKDERHFDRFDVVFGHCFKGLEGGTLEIDLDLPEEWLRRLTERWLSEEDKAEIEALGGWDKLIERLRERLRAQARRHEGGKAWIGTAGTSPFGGHGYNPEGVRIGQGEGRKGRAVKVWDRRIFRNLDDQVILGTRNIKMALRRLRRFAREGAELELDLPDTIRSTARNGGHLDLKLVPERRNKVKVLLLLDVGGSMEPHARTCEELFSAARGEFKHLETFYFHNFLYERLWRDNRRRQATTVATWELLRTYGADYKLILVGDATMSPYEITTPGGSVEHWNEECGEVWLRRLLASYGHATWLNPVRERHWAHTPSVALTRELVARRMYPLTLDGLDRAMRELNR